MAQRHAKTGVSKNTPGLNDQKNRFQQSKSPDTFGAWSLSKPCIVHFRCLPIRPPEAFAVKPSCAFIAIFLDGFWGTFPLPMFAGDFF